MTPAQQSELMVRFARTRYQDGCASYESADCVGVVRLILRDYAKIEVPDDRADWAMHFDMRPWPADVADFDVLLMQNSNTLGLVDHMAVHIGKNLMVQLCRSQDGLICDLISKHANKILYVARYRQ